MKIRKLILCILALIMACMLAGSAGIFLTLMKNDNNTQLVNDTGMVRGGIILIFHKCQEYTCGTRKHTRHNQS